MKKIVIVMVMALALLAGCATVRKTADEAHQKLQQVEPVEVLEFVSDAVQAILLSPW